MFLPGFSLSFGLQVTLLNNFINLMTVINNTSPASQPAGDNGMGFLLGVIVLILFVLGIYYYGLPLLQRSTTPSVNVPGKIDVNVNNK